MKEFENSGPSYWKSLDGLAETPAFKEWVEREFPAGAAELEGVNRRQFMKVMAASFGLAGMGMAGCRRPVQTILPYAKQPENLIPGVASYYASSMPGLKGNIPLIVETHSGRPTKVEGNPSYKPFGGASSIQSQASVLDLYDPDRASKSLARGGTLSPEKVRDLLNSVRKAHLEDQGEGLVVVAEPSTSPSRASLLAALAKEFPKATFANYAPLAYDASLVAAKSVFGQPLDAQPRFDEAERILSIDADFITEGDSSIAHARAFTQTRKVKDSEDAARMSRLYVAESILTNTGSMADHRLRLSSSEMGAFTAAVALEVLRAKQTGSALQQPLEGIAAQLKTDPKWVSECALDLLAHRGRALVVAGAHLPESVHVIVHVLNDILQAPVDYIPVEGDLLGLDAAVARLNTGEVENLILLGVNPAYNAPTDLDWPSAHANAKQSICLSDSVNETTEISNVLIARSHYLESWGDGRTFDGTLVPVQPMIEPLFPSFNELEVLARLAGAASNDPYTIVQNTFRELGGSDFNRFLSVGLLENSAPQPAKTSIKFAAAAKLVAADSELESGNQPKASALEVRFTASAHTLDGRYGNNGWLLECPDPITKLTWDNAILISPRLAKELEERDGVQIFPNKKPMNQDNAFFEGAKGTLQSNKAVFNRGKEMAVMAELTLNGRTLKAPIHVVPGMANYTLQLPLGFGRKVIGRVGQGSGFDFYALRETGASAYALKAVLKLTQETYRLANTQEHWSMEGRAIIREGNVDDYSKKPDFAQKMGVESHAPANYGKYKDKTLQEKSLNNYRGNSAYEHPKFNSPDPNVKVWKGKEDKYPKPQQWGMSIDLNSCTGCSACVVACQSENNIPIVGKDQSLRGREMHWMRIDRYFSAAEYDQTSVPEEVQVSFMGMLCQHCENAPCENVCPVNATVHDRSGLNVMAYNRCVGTRYCANNCPYKVRRFNFFDWNKRQIGEFYKGPFGKVDVPEVEKMQKNPNVTVRMRGVMEKCTFCVQRIEAAKISQKRVAGASDNIRVKDGAIKTACQQVCPTDAIVFGDISDPDSVVSKLKDSGRDYSVLGYLNARPRTTYLARLRNPNKRMPDYYSKPHAYSQYDERYGHSSTGIKPSGHDTHPQDQDHAH
ncbi:MAG: Menaquinone reductase, iron-sulfur cluster-binding subunit [Opitutia bacterium UBA7350]|nr:MAG: Menaquinone reductase, iron-sulfur cluster-binding subunit [Opitutae bacterium UBA7350]